MSNHILIFVAKIQIVFTDNYGGFVSRCFREMGFQDATAVGVADNDQPRFVIMYSAWIKGSFGLHRVSPLNGRLSTSLAGFEHTTDSASVLPFPERSAWHRHRYHEPFDQGGCLFSVSLSGNRGFLGVGILAPLAVFFGPPDY
jgi:hypothetical protein